MAGALIALQTRDWAKIESHAFKMSVEISKYIRRVVHANNVRNIQEDKIIISIVDPINVMINLNYYKMEHAKSVPCIQMLNMIELIAILKYVLRHRN